MSEYNELVGNLEKATTFTEGFAIIDELYPMMKERLEHIEKADIVPMDLRGMTSKMIVRVLYYILSLDEELQKKTLYTTILITFINQ